MLKAAIIASLLVLLPSCGYYRGEWRQPAVIVAPETYTKSEVDAINAEIACRANAKTPLQASRCGVRR
jgi:hypothetical protein